MNEDLNIMLMKLVQENVQANQQWSATAIQFLNTLGNAIKEDTEFMRQSVSRIEEIISRIETARTEETEQPLPTQERYPASFYFRHKYPQDVAALGYYLVIQEEGEQLQYQLFDQQWQPVHSGFLPDRTLDSIQAASMISEMEGIKDYQCYEMIADHAAESIREKQEEAQEMDLAEKAQKDQLKDARQEETEEKKGALHGKVRER